MNNQTLAQKPLYRVYDESLESNIVGNYHLSIQSGDGTFSWCLLNSEWNKFLALESYSYNLKQGDADLLEQVKNSVWSKSLSSVSLAYVSDKVTFVPEPLFDERKKNNYSTFNFESNGSDTVLSGKLKSIGCYSVFAIPKEVEEHYKKYFPGIKILHCDMPLIESAIAGNRNENMEKAFLNIRSKSIELVIAKGGSLLYYNTFSYTGAEDVIYYLLFTLEQLKLNPESILLQLTGDIEKNSSLYSTIHKYVRNVGFMPRNNRFEYSYRFNEIPEHAFYSLFSQYLCV